MYIIHLCVFSIDVAPLLQGTCPVNGYVHNQCANSSTEGETVTTHHRLLIDPISISCPFKFRDDAKT